MNLDEISHSEVNYLYLPTFLIILLFFWSSWSFVFPLFGVIILLVQTEQFKKIKTENMALKQKEYIMVENIKLEEEKSVMLESVKKIVADNMTDTYRRNEQDCELIKITAHQESELLKTITEQECEKMIKLTNQKCELLKTITKQECEETRRKWSDISIFSKKHYEEIQQKTTEILKEVDLMYNGHDFEHFFANLLQNINYQQANVTKASGDMGVDIIAVKDGIKYAIQCKRYNSKVDTSAVQQVLSGLEYYKCHIAVVITNNDYTKQAKNFAESTKTILWNRDDLKNMIHEYCKKEYIIKF